MDMVMTYRVHSKIILKVLFIGVFLLVFTSGAVWAADEPSVIANGNCGGTGDGSNVAWTLTDDGVLTFSGTGPMEEYDRFDIPWRTYSDYVQQANIDFGVTTICPYAFYHFGYITNVNIPDSVTSIGDRAFTGCNSLKTIIIPGSVSVVEGFLNCESLESVVLLPGTTEISAAAFRGCWSLVTIVLPESLVTIGDTAFYQTSLEELTIPRNVTYIGSEALYSANLKSITVDTRNTVYSSMDGVLFNKELTTLIEYPDRRFGNTYSVPAGVTTIGESAFTNCFTLNEVYIPATVTYIDESAFNYSPQLASIYVDAESACFSDIEGVLFNKDQTHLLCYPAHREGSTYAVPNGVTHINAYAFSWNHYLTSISFPNSLVDIGESAFGEVHTLETLAIPNSVENIGNYAFVGCTNLTSVLLPNNLVSIPSHVFLNCESLLTLEIPEGVTTIEDGAFLGCYNLTSVTIPNTVESIESIAFSACRSLKTLNIPDSVIYIGSQAFQDCLSLTFITIPSSVSSIVGTTFSGCYALKTIIFEGDAPYIEAAFWGISATVYYPAGNSTWSDEVKNTCNAGADLTWVSYTPDINYHTKPEYRINSISVCDSDGAVLAAMPVGTCFATVSITNLASEGNTLVFLAAYTVTGQYQGMMWVSVEDLPVDATIKVTLPVGNSDGKIANLKAFTVASLSNMTPLGEAVSFLP